MAAYDNPGSEMADLMRRVRVLETQSGADGSGFGGGDGDHPGAGGDSILLGTDGLADGYASVAIGFEAKAALITDTDADEAVAVGTAATADGFGACAYGARSYAQYENASAFGWLSFAGHAFATAIGYRSVTTKANQVRLGRSTEEVSVPGRLNVARRTPSGSADSQGTVGDITSDDNYIYVKTSAGWKRSALSTF
jgi:hypothetical protein